MNRLNDLERELAQWMEITVPRRAPDFLAPSILARTRSMRPRPAWLARLLEPPMQMQLSLRRVVGFGRSPRLILVGLLLLALVAVGVLVGSQLIRQQSLPAPFGPAGNGLIAADVDGAVVLMRPDGSEVRRLDIPFAHVAAMVFSRDGTKVAAWAAESAGATTRTLVVANVDGTELSRLGTFSGPMGDGVSFSPIAWSPDDGRLAFTERAGELRIVDVATASVRDIAPDDSILRRQDPAWAPDGRLAYRCQAGDGLPRLCVTSPDLTSERILPTSRGTDFAFSRSSWSHDGKQIAYYIDDTIDHPASAPGYDIATIDLATETERILTRGTEEHMILPAWTPDDRFILVAGAIVAADGSGVQLIGDGCGWTEPSPDGRFAICVADGSRLELWPVAGGPPTILPLEGSADRVSWQRLGN